jgi:murein DD-endopeptidase MepM/ murein hydrolase activator NlpD
MKDDDVAAGLLVGGLFLLGRGRAPSSEPSSPIETLRWPLPTLVVTTRDGDVVSYPPVVSQEMKPGHNGVDICYRRKEKLGQDKPPWWRSGMLAASRTWDGRHFREGVSSSSGGWFFAPKNVPVLAAAAGRLWASGASPRGRQALVDHGNYVTYYQHMETLAVPMAAKGFITAVGPRDLGKVNEQWRVGDGGLFSGKLGTMGGDPLQGSSAFRHLHFEVWRYRRTAEGRSEREYVDPALWLASAEQWSVEIKEYENSYE